MINLVQQITHQERLLFTKHLDTMIKAGITIDEAIVTLKDQTRSSAFNKILTNIVSDIENGKSLSQAFAKHPKVFNEIYTSLIEVGEESGTLEEALDFLAQQQAKDYALRKKITGALFYPGLVLGATFILGTFISIFILPKLVEFFNSFDIELPITTKILMYISQFFDSYGIIFLISLALFLFLFVLLIRIEKVKYFWHSLLIRIPLFGRLIIYGQLSRFSRNLGTLLKSGVPVARSVEITADTLSNLKFKKDLSIIQKSLVKGKGIGKTMDEKRYFEYPPLVSKMISIGEKTGKLDESLLYLGNFYEEEIDDISKNLSTIIEPFLLISIALVVGFVALAIISPIYELTGSIRK